MTNKKAAGRIEAVIFDMDGLMFDTEALNRKAWIEAGRKHGCEMTDGILSSHIGLDLSEVRRRMCEYFGPGFDFDAVRADRLAWSRNWIEKNGMPEKPGLRELLKWLERHGEIKTAIATSSGRSFVDFYLSRAELNHRFDAIVTWQEGMRGKPEPDLFLAAAQQLGADPGRCVVLEDSYNGIRAAHSAGMMPVMVPDLLPPTQEILSLVYRKADSLNDVVFILEDLCSG